MSKVEIFKLNNEGDQELLATCVLGADGVVACSGPGAFVRNLFDLGIRDYDKTGGPNLFPKDGLKFLEQLKFNLRSAYLSATDVQET